MDISGRNAPPAARDAAAHGLANIRTVRSDWENFTPDRRYEVVFASMTPALDSEAGKEKLLACAAGWVVYMGFLDRMASDLMQGLYAHYGITPRVFNNAQIMEQWLTTRGIRCTALPVKGQWTVSRNREDTLDVCVTTLQHYGVDPDRNCITRPHGGLSRRLRRVCGAHGLHHRDAPVAKLLNDLCRCCACCCAVRSWRQGLLAAAAHAAPEAPVQTAARRHASSRTPWGARFTCPRPTIRRLVALGSSMAFITYLNAQDLVVGVERL